MRLFKVVCLSTGKAVQKGFTTKVQAKAYRNELNGKIFTHKISRDVDHWNY